MSIRAESEALHERVRAFIEASLRGGDVEAFDSLALDIARFQAAHVAPLKRLSAVRGARLSEATDAGAIPAIPCDVFRLSRVSAHEAAEDVRLFRTSGTSQGASARGEHALRTTATYELGALAWGRRMVWPDRDRMRCIVLGPAYSEAEDSSLSFMIDRFASALGGPSSFHLKGGALSVEGAARSTAEASPGGASTSAPTRGAMIITSIASSSASRPLRSSPRICAISSATIASSG